MSYREAYESFRWSVPADFNIAGYACARWARERERFALYWEDESGAASAWTYWDLQQAANRLSNALAAMGIARGDRVALILPQRPETIVTYIACFQMAAVAVPLSFLFGPDALEYRLANSGAKVVIVDAQTAPNFEAVRARLPAVTHVIGAAGASGPDYLRWEDTLARASRHFEATPTKAADPAAIIYTSGTTGAPKGALLPHQALIGNLPGFVHSHDAFPQPGDLFWSPADWAWTGGLWDALMPTMYHGRAIVGYRGRFDAERAFHILEKYAVRNTFLFPTALKMMVWPVKPGSMGRPYPGHRIAVIDDEGREQPPGAVGDVAVHRRWIDGTPDPVFFLGYWGNDAATAAKYTGDWCRTGDQALADDDGYLWYQGRDDDMFKVAGYRVGPTEIENCLVKHPAVANCAVVPTPDETRGAVVKAFVLLAPGQNGSEELKDSIREHVKRQLAAYQQPREIEFVSELPMTTTGKVQRKVLRDREMLKTGSPTPRG